jgi:hypothetical protein
VTVGQRVERLERVQHAPWNTTEAGNTTMVPANTTEAPYPTVPPNTTTEAPYPAAEHDD